MLKYFDETGLGLMLSVVNSWFIKGKGRQFKIPTRWGSTGRINVLGTVSLTQEGEQLEYRMLEESCSRIHVVDYFETLAEQADPEKPTVLVLDNAAFHKGGEIAARTERWKQQGLYLYYLPPYCPFLNLIETIWRKLKGFVMPRRSYDSIEELKEALTAGLKLLGGVNI